MEIETVEVLDRKNLDIGDVLIHHKPEFHRKTTTIFVKDRGRKPNYELSDSNMDSISNWIYDIMKIEHDLITNWDKIRPLLMRDWKSFDNSTKRKISRLKEHEEKKKFHEYLVKSGSVLADRYKGKEGIFSVRNTRNPNE